MRPSSSLLLLLLPFLSTASTTTPPATSDANLNLDITVSFPDNPIQPSELNPNPKFKLINNRPNKINIQIHNHEANPIGLQFIGGSLLDPTNKQNSVLNLTTQTVGIDIESGKKSDVIYVIKDLDMMPRDVRLSIGIVLKTKHDTRSGEDKIVTMPVYNSTVEVVEEDLSLFDPQLLFLYLLLGAGFVGSGYWAYNTWLASMTTGTIKRGGGLGKKERKGDGIVPPGSAAGGIAGTGATSTALGTGKYDQSWIPEHHLKKSTAQRGRVGKKGSGNRSE